MLFDLPPLELLAIAATLVAGVALVVFVVRWAERERVDEQEAIQAFNAMLERVAALGPLSDRKVPGEVHPVVGLCRAYSRLSGTMGGLKLSLSVERTGGPDAPYFDRIELTLHPDDDDSWAANQQGSWQASRPFWSRAKNPPDAGPNFSALRKLAHSIDVGPGHIRITALGTRYSVLGTRYSVLGTRSGSDQSVLRLFFKRDEELLAFLDLAVKACDELRAQTQS